MSQSTLSQNADELRKQKKYLEAIPLYTELAKTSQNSYPLRWLIYCLRKTGQLDQALKTGEDALNNFPDDKYLRSEMGWVIYDRDLKPGKEAGNIGQVINAARRTLEMDRDNAFLTNKVVQAVMKTAKKANNPDWKIIAEFAEMVDPATLSDEKRNSSDGKQYMSEKEDWFVNTSHAYLKLGSFQKAMDIAQDGLRSFPGELFLNRTIALARFRSGDAKAGAETMRQLLQHPRRDWYILSELAEMEMSLDNDQEAYRLFCQALLTKQDNQFKVKNLELFADLSIKMEKLDQAWLALNLARAVRTEASWSIPASLTMLEEKCRKASQTAGKRQPEEPMKQSDLARACEKVWREGAAEGLERHQGKLVQLRPDRKYAFIQPINGGESPIVFLRDLPRDCMVEGTLVEYSLEKSFDVKKNRDSFKAVHINKARMVS